MLSLETAAAGRFRSLTEEAPARPATRTVERSIGAATGGHPAAEERLRSERLGVLFDVHHQRLYRLARRMAGDAEEARDLVQEAFLRAARRPRSLPGSDSGCEAWLVRTLVNLCRDRQRRRRVRERALPAPDDAGGPYPDPEAAVVARRAVQTALAQLPARRRAVIALHELEERSVQEIAALLGVAQVTVRWHLASGREQLRRILSRDLPAREGG